MHAATAQGAKNYVLLDAGIEHLLPRARKLLDFGSQVRVAPAPLFKTDLEGITISFLCPVQTVYFLTVWTESSSHFVLQEQTVGQ